MPTVELVFAFLRADGGTSRITIDNAREDVTEVEANALMDQIIAADIFEPNGSSLSEKLSIELISTETVEFQVV